MILRGAFAIIWIVAIAMSVNKFVAAYVGDAYQLPSAFACLAVAIIGWSAHMYLIALKRREKPDDTYHGMY